MRRLLAPLALAVALLTNSGAVTVPTSTLAAATKLHIVTISGYTFRPRLLVIAAGDTVVWINKDADQHSVIGDGKLSTVLRSRPLGRRARYTVTFSRAGTFAYHCGFHAFMSGTVRVRTRSGA